MRKCFFTTIRKVRSGPRKPKRFIRTTLDAGKSTAGRIVSEQVYLMNHINCQAILVECGFLSNSEEELLLQSDGYQSKLAAVLMSSYLNHHQ